VIFSLDFPKNYIKLIVQMPQLDHLSFLSQIFFLFLFFIGFYFVLLHTFLPRLAMALKVRKWKLSGGSVASQDMGAEHDEVHGELTKAVAAADKVVNDLLSGSESTGIEERQGNLNLLTNVDKDGSDAQVRFVRTSGELRGQTEIVRAHLKS